MELDAIDSDAFGVSEARECEYSIEKDVLWNGRLVGLDRVEDLTAMVNFRVELHRSISREKVCGDFYLGRSVGVRDGLSCTLSEDEEEVEEEEAKGGGSITAGGRVDASGGRAVYVEYEGHNASGNISGSVRGEAGKNSSGDSYAEVKGDVTITW